MRGRVAVVDLVACCHPRYRQCFLRDARCRAALARHAVVTYIASGVAAYQRYRFASGCILVIERACRSDCETVASYQTAEACARSADRRGICAVIGLVSRSNARNGQGLLRHVRCGAALARDRVIGYICTDVGADQRHCLACAYVLVIKRAGGCNAERIA